MRGTALSPTAPLNLSPRLPNCTDILHCGGQVLHALTARARFIPTIKRMAEKGLHAVLAQRVVHLDERCFF